MRLPLFSRVSRKDFAASTPPGSAPPRNGVSFNTTTGSPASAEPNRSRAVGPTPRMMKSAAKAMTSGRAPLRGAGEPVGDSSPGAGRDGTGLSGEGSEAFSADMALMRTVRGYSSVNLGELSAQRRRAGGRPPAPLYERCNRFSAPASAREPEPPPVSAPAQKPRP